MRRKTLKPGFTPKGNFRGHQRETKRDRQYDINQQENTAPVFRRQIWKTPKIAKSYGRSCRGQHKTDFSTEFTSATLSSSTFLSSQSCKLISKNETCSQYAIFWAGLQGVAINSMKNRCFPQILSVGFIFFLKTVPINESFFND